MRIDAHLHTSKYSNCGKQTPDELLRAARKAGLNGLIVTDHSRGNRVWFTEELNSFKQHAEDNGLVLFSGVEVGCIDGFDYLVYGSLDFLTSENHSNEKYLEPETLIDMAHREGCFVAIAHPYRRPDDVVPPRVYDLALDGVEIKSYNMSTAIQQDRAMALAETMDCCAIAGSDAHIQARVGGYGMELEHWVTEEQELIEALKDGKYRIFEQASNAV